MKGNIREKRNGAAGWAKERKASQQPNQRRKSAKKAISGNERPNYPAVVAKAATSAKRQQLSHRRKQLINGEMAASAVSEETWRKATSQQ